MHSHPSPPSSARIAVFHGANQPFEFREWAIPETLGPGECLVEILCATLCGSDLHTLHGKRQEPTPCILGHEAIGRVVRVGLDRETALLGRRVTWSLADSCHHCTPCLEWDLPQKCVQLFKYGHARLNNGSGLNGCYASHVLLRAGTEIVEVPDTVTNSMAAPANCALATMVAATERGPSTQGCAVIQGAGLLGLLGCALLKSKGWRRVVVVDVSEQRLGLVTAFGGTPALGSAKEMAPAGTVDWVLEASGNPRVVSEGIELLRPGGFYTWVGMVHPDSQLTLSGETVIRKCLTVHGLHNYAPRHLRDGMKFLASAGSHLPWEQTVSPPFPLRDLDAAIRLAETGQWPRVAIQPG